MAWRNAGRDRRRSVLSAAAVAVAVAAVCFMKAYVDGLLEDVARNVLLFETGHVKVVHRDWERERRLMPLDLAVWGYRDVVARLEGVRGVVAVLPRTRFAAMADTGKELRHLSALAVDAAAERSGLDLERRLVAGRIFREWSEGPEAVTAEVLLGKGLAEELGLGPGDKVTLLTRTAEEGLGHMTFRVAGVVSFGTAVVDREFLVMPLSAARRFLAMEDAVTELLVFGRDRRSSRVLAERVRAVLEGPYVALDWRTQEGGVYGALVEGGGLMYGFFYVMFLLLASLVPMNSVLMSVLERRREIGTMAALGMRPGGIVGLFVLEAGMVSAVGSLVGTLLGGAVAWHFSRAGIDFAELSGGGIGIQASDVLFTEFGVPLLVFSFVFGLAVPTLCAWLAAGAAAKVPAAEAMRRAT